MIKLNLKALTLGLLLFSGFWGGHASEVSGVPREEKVVFVDSKAGVTLHGTLAFPQGVGPFPAVVLISGYGPDLRDGYLGGNYFVVLSNALVDRGIAVLRYDKRGTGESSGVFDDSTSRDFANDVVSGVEYLKDRKDIDPHRIGLVGHSEGGLIAPMVAADSKDVAFIVLMAGTGVNGYSIQLHQQEAFDKANGLDGKSIDVRNRIRKRLLDMMIAGKDNSVIRSSVKGIVREEVGPLGETASQTLLQDQDYWQGQVDSCLKTPWWRFFLLYDPKTSLRKVTCPVLAVAGTKDMNVDPKENFPAIEGALKEGKNRDYTLRLLPDLGHDLNDSTVRKIIADWIVKHTR